MRTLVDIPDAQVRALDGLAKDQGRSRAALIRDAIGELLDRCRSEPNPDAFGLWRKTRGRDHDGLDYQERIRREW